MTVHVRAGTSGYSYKEWRGSFYPEELGADGWLSFYASQLPAVEINNTFYRMPKTHVVEAWRDAVPDDFRFVLKASRRITHLKRLKEPEEPLGYLVDRARVLGGKLGALLFQLPPNFPRNLERLASFVALLPPDLPAVFEFRHDSWFEAGAAAELADVLGPRGLVVNDDGSGALDARKAMNAPPSAGPLYFRLRGERYTRTQLQRWLKAIEAHGAGDAFVFFKHEDAGAGPKLARQFLTLAAATPARAPRKAAAPKPAARAGRSKAGKAGPATGRQRGA